MERERERKMEPGAEVTEADDRAKPAEVAVADETGGRLESIIESVLFASGGPMTVKQLIDILKGPRGSGPKAKEIERALTQLLEEYAPGRRGIQLLEVSGGYQFRTARENAQWVRAVFRDKPARLGRATLETLAIVAYKQPATRADIESVRGVDADAALATLLERRLVKIAGRKETVGRPLLYSTTPDFLEAFGLNDLKDLPSLKELGPVPDAEEDHPTASAETPTATTDGESEPAPVAVELETAPVAAEFATAPGAAGFATASGAAELATAPGAAELETAPGAAEFATASGAAELETAPGAAEFETAPSAAEAEPAPGAAEPDWIGTPAEAAEPGGDQLAPQGGGTDPGRPGPGEWQGDDAAGDEGGPADRSHHS